MKNQIFNNNIRKEIIQMNFENEDNGLNINNKNETENQE